MRILAFDTSLNKTYVTLTRDGETVLGSKVVESVKEKYHSAFLISSIIEILQDNALAMEHIDIIAVNLGPGSFTGIRACVTVARVIAEQLNKKTIGISSLEILAQINTSNKNALATLDARQGQCFVATYSPEGKELSPPEIISTQDLIKSTRQNEYFIMSDTKMHELLNENQINSTCYENEDYGLGNYLADIAYKKYQKGEGISEWYNLKPLYLQVPPVLKNKACS